MRTDERTDGQTDRKKDGRGAFFDYEKAPKNIHFVARPLAPQIIVLQTMGLLDQYKLQFSL
jgi:hypothetical protein